MSTRSTLILVMIHQLRVLSPFQVSNRYIIASVILAGQTVDTHAGVVHYSHAEERTQEGSDNREKIIENGDRLGNDERDQGVGGNT
jgi:hypothetical protein